MTKKVMDYAIHTERPYGILIAGHYSVDANYAISRPSGSTDYLLIYTISGEGQIQLDQDNVTCSVGDMAILLPGSPHNYCTKGEEWEIIWAHFIPDPQWNTLLRPVADQKFIFHSITSIESRDSIQNALMRMVRNELPGVTSMLHRRLSELSLEEALVYVQLNGDQERVVSIDPRISEIVQDLQLNPAQKVSLPELAKKSCLSVSRLSHLFKEQMGDTILNTLNKYRLDRAAQLLVGTQRQVSEIAVDVGFDCAIHFTRKFRDTFGETPSKYRKRKRDELKRANA